MSGEHQFAGGNLGLTANAHGLPLFVDDAPQYTRLPCGLPLCGLFVPMWRLHSYVATTLIKYYLSYAKAEVSRRSSCCSEQRVSAVRDDEELQLGQIYFALPLNRLKRRMLAEDMAELAVKASSALTKSGCCDEKGGGYCPNILVFPDENGMKPSRKVAGGGQSGLRRGRSSGGCGRRGKITAKLITIPE
ncbi:unnamed protein product [Fraxinus pennsylvanica]|uniref:Uncharacterized protein n=1 Tax=Fraxinus pennsylvanica TaxID=56036 RepID=A0AAD1Z465_9LAMI|nr:unnamed protein product [Fraxinus pennsylvanica]